jgi:hypothetical protein
MAPKTREAVIGVDLLTRAGASESVIINGKKAGIIYGRNGRKDEILAADWRGVIGPFPNVEAAKAAIVAGPREPKRAPAKTEPRPELNGFPFAQKPGPTGDVCDGRGRWRGKVLEVGGMFDGHTPEGKIGRFVTYSDAKAAVLAASERTGRVTRKKRFADAT